jgi:hypothetical protein
MDFQTTVTVGGQPDLHVGSLGKAISGSQIPHWGFHWAPPEGIRLDLNEFGIQWIVLRDRSAWTRPSHRSART